MIELNFQRWHIVGSAYSGISASLRQDTDI